MPCTRQQWTTLGRIVHDFGERLIGEWIDVTQETGLTLEFEAILYSAIRHYAM